MKSKDKERLQQDLIKYSNQIGILPEERPNLILNRREYHDLKVDNGMPKWTAAYGECIATRYGLNTIFVDAGKRSYQRRIYHKSTNVSQYQTPNHIIPVYTYKSNRNGITEFKMIKSSYKTKLHVLVHELVHYRFRYLGHGAKFEQRINEILRGKTFPIKQLNQLEAGKK